MRKTLLLFLLFSIMLTGCGPAADSEDSEIIKKKVKVQSIVQQDEVVANLTLSGTVTPKQHSLVRSLVPGTIEFLAPVGSAVYIGQPLFSIRDANIENSYFNALQNLEQTQVITQQRVQQAELGLNSAKASLDLARSQFDSTIAQTDQALRIAEDSAIVAYNSAYNNINQVLLYLNDGSSLENQRYAYRDIMTAQIQLRTDTKFKFDQAVDNYLDLEYPLTSEDEIMSLENMQTALSLVKNAVDNTVILLQHGLPIGVHDADRAIVIGYQTAINQHVSGIITSINAINNTKIGNRLSLNNAQAQLDLAEIQYNNADVSLANAQEGAVLENNIAHTQLDGIAYNYNNLTLSAPFAGTILSHFSNPGEQVNIGQELIELGDLSIVEMVVDVDVAFAEAIKLNDKVMIDDQYEGFVTEVDPVGDLTSGKVSVAVQSEQAESALVAGSIADLNLNLNYQVDNLIVIPIKTATIEAADTYVFVVEDGKVARKSVTLGQIFGDKVSVIGGLEEGDQLILRNGVFVATGDQVEIIE